MLKALTISNLAVIESVDLEWSGGFSVLTGETGAGKSILIDAIGLIAGTRADSGLIRGDAERAEVSAQFEIRPDSAAAASMTARLEIVSAFSMLKAGVQLASGLSCGPRPQ